MKNGIKIALSVAAIVGALVLIPALLVAGFVGTLREDTEIYRVESPDGSHYAVVMESDQGAMGGATFVDLVESPTKILFFSVPGKTRRIYTGRWEEAQTIQVSWESENVLLINGQAYPIA